MKKTYYDPYQLHSLMTDLRKHNIYASEFAQTTDRLTACGQCLYDLIRYHNLELYPDKDVKQHILNAVAKTTPRGFRIVKDVKSKRIDIAISLAMATYAMTQIFIPKPEPTKTILHNLGAGILWVKEVSSDKRPILTVERF